MACDEQRLPFQPVLHDLARWMRQSGARGVVIGGVAASMWGRPRTTRDVDVTVLLHEDEWPTLLAAGKECGFEPRIADALEFAAESRVLLMRHLVTAVDLDLVLASLPFEQLMVERAIAVRLNGDSVWLCSPEDLVVMKALAGRPRDIADIEGVLQKNRNLDKNYIRRCLSEFAILMDDRDIAGRFETLLKNS